MVTGAISNTAYCISCHRRYLYIFCVCTSLALCCSIFQVHSAPVVEAPLIKEHPDQPTITSSFEFLPQEEAPKKETHSESVSPMQTDSSQISKFTFGLKKSTTSVTPSARAPVTKKSRMDIIFSSEADEIEEKPKKKLVPIDYSDEEDSRGRGVASNGTIKLGKRKMSSSTSESFGSQAQVDGKTTSNSVKIDTSAHESALGIVRNVSSETKPPSDKKFTADERKKMVQSLVNSIPSSKLEVFQYTLRWEQMDAVSLFVCLFV